MPSSIRSTSSVAAAVVVIAWLAAAGAARFSEAGSPTTSLPSFFPAAKSVELRKLAPSTIGPTVELTAVLDASGIVRLAEVTGQRSLANVVVGKERLVLHDDGQGGDPIAGDGRFTALTFLDPNEVLARAALEERLAAAGRLDRLRVFRDRELTGRESRRPLSARDFAAGLPVPIKPLPVGPEGGGPNEDFQNAVTYSLFISNSLPGGGLPPPVFWDLTRIYDPCFTEGNGDGVWTFGHLMRQMASGTGLSAEAFTEQWLTHYTADQTNEATNQFTVPAISGMAQFIADWKAAGGGEIDLDRPPFRLQAIVPRVDLRKGASSPYGGAHDGGELRFIFGAVKPAHPCSAIDFSVIVEYGVPIEGCVAQRDWARGWRDLTALGLDIENEEAYLAALEVLTTQITEAGSDPGTATGSALNQLRSNERDLGSGCCWRIREFHLGGSGLEQATTADTPDAIYRYGIPDYKVFDALILSPSIPGAPLFMPGPGGGPEVRFRGAEAIVGFPSDGPAWGSTSDLDFSQAAMSDQRYRRALQTCSGCHARETGTQNAHMVHPVTGVISPFLIGADFPDTESPQTVLDPVAPVGSAGSKERSFFDLLRRYDDLETAANRICGIVAVDELSLAQLEE